MKNIVIIKNLPSNLIEEAIVVIKDNAKVSSVDNLIQDKKRTNNNIVSGMMKDEDFKKIRSIQKDNRKYVVKEAEMVVSDYLNKIEENKKYLDKIKFKSRYKKIKMLNLILALISMLSTMICIIK